MSPDPLAVEIEAMFPEIDGERLDEHLRSALERGSEIKIVVPIGTNGSYTFVPTVIREISR